MTYELYALRYGTQPDLAAREALLFPDRRGAARSKQPFSYFFWIARSATDIIMIDCGFSREEGALRGRETVSNVPDLLHELSLSPEQIGDLVLTHLHYDHVGNLALFPDARLHVHAQEWAWVTSPAMADRRHANYYRCGDISVMLDRLYNGRVELMERDQATVRGLDITRTGGHSPGQTIVTVPTLAGPVVLASDASHLDVNWRQRNPFPILHEMEGVLRGYEILAHKSAAGALIVAGHDPSIFDSHEIVGTSGHVVALHKPIGSRQS